eukprot:gene6328-2952_t
MGVPHQHQVPFGGNDYIPAFKAPDHTHPTAAFKGRKSNKAAFEDEAAELPDGRVDMRQGCNSGRTKVYENNTFDWGSAPKDSCHIDPFSAAFLNRNSDPHTEWKGAETHPQTNTSPYTLKPMCPKVSKDRVSRPSATIFDPTTIIATRQARKPHSPAESHTRSSNPRNSSRSSHTSNTSATVATRAASNQSYSIRRVNAAAWETELKHSLAGTSRLDAVLRPGPPLEGGLVRCYVRRSKNLFGTHPTFYLHMENSDIFLLAARRRKKSKTSSFVISQDEDDLKRDTGNCLGKVKANFSGTEYLLWGKSSGADAVEGFGNQHMCVNFKSQAGPRTMYVMVPTPEAQWRPTGDEVGGDLSASLEAARNHELAPNLGRKASMFVTKTAEYDESVKGASLDFKGRVKKSSLKNLQLVSWDSNTDKKGSEVVLQFGKVDDNLFALDFAYPFSIESAFAIALSTIDTKLCFSL